MKLLFDENLKPFRVAVFLILVILVSTGRSLASQAVARVDKTDYLVGDPIPVHIEIVHPKGAVFKPLVTETIGTFHLMNRGLLKPLNDTTTTSTLVVARYDAGAAVLPPVSFQYSIAGDPSPRTLSTNPLTLTIRLAPVDTTQEIKDIKPPLSISLTLADIARMAAIALVLMAALYLLYRRWKKRPIRKTEKVYVPPPRSAHLIALEQLEALREKKLWQQGLIKPYYSEATEIVRRYLENRYGFPALEQTSDEIMADLRQYVHDAEIVGKTETVLRRADLVKFAKYIPAISEHEEMLTVAFDIVNKTSVPKSTTSY
ncbi:MAG: hypothetical protein HY201_01145 [Nitrospirae bacterium]|nr:hypothetical protein [Candidatus Troglogloeales bacterium]